MKIRNALITLTLIACTAFLATETVAQIDLFDSPPIEQPARVVHASSVLSVTSCVAGEVYDGAVVLDIDSGWHINSNRPTQDWLIPADVSFEAVDGIVAKDVHYPKPKMAMLMDERMSVFDDRVVIRFRVKIDESMPDGEYTLPVLFQYQPCDDKTCLSPETEKLPLAILVGEAGQAIHPDIFSAGSEEAIEPEQTAGVEAESDIQRLIDEYGFWGYFIALGLAFVTGLLLSFSPCTYPMIPITVSVFAGQNRSVGRGFVLSLFYVGSMAVVYGLMGLIVSLVGGVFGAWLSSPPVVIGIVIIFVIFSLSMFGLYELQVPASLRMKLGAKKSGGGVVSSIILGIVAALVVSPCVGPFVAGILLYVATTGSPVIGFLVLFVFALGLGTLFLLIGTFSSAISGLPGAGSWMESVKKFFGFVLLAMALYFLMPIVPSTMSAVLFGLLLLSFGVFGGGFDRLTTESGFFDRLKKLLGLLAFLVGAYLLIGVILINGLILPPAQQWLPAVSGDTAMETQEIIPWERDLDSGLNNALSQGKPVLIDTWATWCANCRVLDKKTFGDPDVAKEAERFVPIKVQLEKSGSQITRDFMTRFGLTHFSLPTTLLLDSGGEVRKVMRGVVDPENMISEMRKVR